MIQEVLEGLRMANEAYQDYRRGRAIRLGMYNNEPKELGKYKSPQRQMGNYMNY